MAVTSASKANTNSRTQQTRKNQLASLVKVGYSTAGGGTNTKGSTNLSSGSGSGAGSGPKTYTDLSKENQKTGTGSNVGLTQGSGSSGPVASSGGSKSNAGNKKTGNSTNAGLTQGSGSAGPSVSSGGSGGYKKYIGGNANLDAALSQHSAAYKNARERALAGDSTAVAEMQRANEEANKLRNQYGYAAESAVDDINYAAKQSGYNTAKGGQTAGVGSVSGMQGADTPSYAGLLQQQQNAYDQIQAEQEKSKRAAVEKAVSDLESQKGEVGQSYADLFRQLYIDRRMAEKRMPQQMAAMGYTGGLTESSLLKLATQYAEARRQGEQERMNTISDIDKAIRDTELQGDISIAENVAQTAKDKLSSYANILQAMQAQANADRNYQLQQDQLSYSKLMDDRNYKLQQDQLSYSKLLDDRNFEYQKEQDKLAQDNWLATLNRQELLDGLEREDLDYERKLAAAQYLFENTGDASGLKTLGYTDGQIAALQNRWAAEMAQKGQSRAVDVGGYDPKLTYSQVQEAINSGNFTPQVLADYEYYMGTPFAPGPSDEIVSEGYKRVGDYVARVADTVNGLSKAYNYIVNAANNGTITKAEAQALLEDYGLM